MHYFRLNRREFLRLMSMMGVLGAAPGALVGCSATPPAVSKAPTASAPAAGATAAPAGAPAASPAAPVAPVAVPGEPVPELEVTYQSGLQWMADLARKVALDGGKVGLKYKLNGVATPAWLNAINNRTYGAILFHDNNSREFRDADPTEMVVSRLHSREAKVRQRNFGDYANPEVDRLAEIVETELDQAKRKQASDQIQEIMAKDYYLWCSASGPNPLNAYNSADWDNVTSTPGAGITGENYPWSWLSIKPKTNRKRAIAAHWYLDPSNIQNPFGINGVRGIPAQLYRDKMLALGPDLKIKPWVLTDWKMQDKLTWLFTVRSGMKWHDGRPATAEDVAFSFNYIAKWKPSSIDVVNQALDHAEVVDPTTVKLVTKRPAANMTTDLLLRCPFVPKHIWENLVESQNAKDPSALKPVKEMTVGSGPYKFDHFTPDVEVLVTANRDHWQPPNIDELLVILVPDADAVLGKLESKEIDFEFVWLTPSQASRIKTQSHISVVEAGRSLNPFICPYFAHMPWKDPVFRKAWHRTVDKKYLVDVVFEGAGKVLPFNSLFAEAHPFYNPNISERFEYNLDEARKILADGGYTWDKNGQLLYPGPDNADFKKRTA